MDNLITIIMSASMLLLGLRFMMQLAGVDPYNPVYVSTLKSTYVVDVFGRILPTVQKGRINLAALVLICLIELIWVFYKTHGGENQFSILMVNFNIDSHLDIVVDWLLSLLVDFLFFCKWAIIASIILSWVRVFNQSPSVFLGAVMEVVMQMTEPLLAPFRRIMPDLGPIDLSPMVAFLAIIICQHLLGAAAVTLLAMV